MACSRLCLRLVGLAFIKRVWRCCDDIISKSCACCCVSANMNESLEITYDPQILVGNGYYLSFKLIARENAADFVLVASFGRALHRSLNDRTKTFFHAYNIFALQVFIILIDMSLIYYRCSGLKLILVYLTFRRSVNCFPDSICNSSFSLSMVFYKLKMFLIILL